MIIIHAFIHIHVQYRDAFLELTKQVSAGSQAEEGNISYYFYEDPVQPGNFVVVEKWKDQAAIQYHEGTVHFKEFISGIQEFLSQPLRVELYEAAALN